MFNVLTKLRLRRALSRAATQSAPVLQPTVEHVERQVQGTGRDWKASPAVKPMEWTEDVRAHNAAIDKAERLAVLERFADALQGVPGSVPKRNPLLISQDVIALTGHVDEWLAATVQLYFDCETAQLWSKRTNVTGLGPLMPRLTPAEIADAREASRLQSIVQAKEWAIKHEMPPAEIAQFDAKRKKDLRDIIIDNLGGMDEILKMTGGNVELAEQVIAKGHTLFKHAQEED